MPTIDDEAICILALCRVRPRQAAALDLVVSFRGDARQQLLRRLVRLGYLVQDERPGGKYFHTTDAGVDAMWGKVTP